MESGCGRVLFGLAGLAALFTAFILVVLVETGPCPKSGTPEFFTNPRIPLAEKAVPAFLVLALAGAGGMMLSWALRRSRRPGDPSGSPR
jgi:hypothetical protein